MVGKDLRVAGVRSIASYRTTGGCDSGSPGFDVGLRWIPPLLTQPSLPLSLETFLPLLALRTCSWGEDTLALACLLQLTSKNIANQRT